MTIKVVDYDPAWPRLFEELRRRVWAVVGDIALSVEHVGSTAVPGLAAKPIIDLSIVVPTEDDVPRAIERLATIGYVHRGNLGVEGREAFHSPVPGPPSKPVPGPPSKPVPGPPSKPVPGPPSKPVPGPPTHHLYLCPAGSPGLRNHLAVRDYLRAHPHAARQYAALKKQLAADHPHDIEAYIAGKTAFILDILRQANFPPDQLESIETANRPPGDTPP